ncbi:MAG: CBS domain-containing protein [Candidatus Marsarchaeota archaeon]|nr:CBS domain-containing protein [Candidatus Marsarchaeota archaeon]MCL5094691.1 CBS domain-containing protein [Candidatus Marsarchaeota archaeon]
MVKLNINYVPESLISKTLVLDYKEQITKILPIIAGKKYEGVIINKNNEYFGIIDSKAIYRFSELKLSKNESVENFVIKAPVIDKHTPLFDVINYFINVKINILPYHNKNKIEGILTRQTMLKILISSKLINETEVGKIMTIPIIAINTDTDISVAKKIMFDHKIGKLIVLKDNKPIGILSLKDITYKYTLNDRLPEMKDIKYSPKNIDIESIIEKNIKTIDYNDSLLNAARKMIEEDISSLLVIKDSRYIGIITISDILKNIIINNNISENRILLSGVDDEIKEYKDEIIHEIEEEIDKIEKMSDYKIVYFTLNIKRNNRFYQLYGRVNLEKIGIISLHVEEFLLDKALKKLLTLIDKELKKDKEQLLTMRKIDNNE